MGKLKNDFIRHRNSIQNVLIILLCITVLIEVSHLWFVNLSNGQSFFIKQTKSVAKTQYKVEFISPKRILSSSSYNNFHVLYEGDIYNEVINNVNEILISSATKSNFIESGKYNDGILNHKNLVIFDYDYEINNKMLLEALNINKNNYGRLKDFDKILFANNSQAIDIYFINSTSREYYRYSLEDSTLASRLFSINEISSDITYSYNLGKNNYIGEDDLIANIDKPFYYNKVTSNNPFTTIYGDSPRNLVESKVDKYFDNSSYGKLPPSESAYIFSDTNTVVKYFDNGILEYSYYDVASNSYEYSIVEDFAIAKAFIEADDDIVNKYYLKNYYRNNFDTIFEFVYVVNNFPIKQIDDNGFSDISISVTVKNNIVINYIKDVNTYSVENETIRASKPLYEALSILSMSENDSDIKNVVLAYKSNNGLEEMTLYWFMEAFESGMSFSTN